jgi:hypothetical protein
VVLNAVLFLGLTARMISSSALSSAIPIPSDRGAFMSINSSLQQLSGGVASSVAGLIIVQTSEGPLARYEILGYVVTITMVMTMILLYKVHVMVQQSR